MDAIVAWLHVHSVVFMTAVFGAVAIYAYWPGNRALIEQNGQIPFRDDR